MFENEKRFIARIRKETEITEESERYNRYLLLKEEIEGDKSEEKLLLILQQYFPLEATTESINLFFEEIELQLESIIGSDVKIIPLNIVPYAKDMYKEHGNASVWIARLIPFPSLAKEYGGKLEKKDFETILKIQENYIAYTAEKNTDFIESSFDLALIEKDIIRLTLDAFLKHPKIALTLSRKGIDPNNVEDLLNLEKEQLWVRRLRWQDIHDSVYRLYYELNELERGDILTAHLVAEAMDLTDSSEAEELSAHLGMWRDYGFTNEQIEEYHDRGYTDFQIAKDLQDIGITLDSTFFYNSELVEDLFKSRNYDRDLRNIEYAFEQWEQDQEDERFREEEE